MTYKFRPSIIFGGIFCVLLLDAAAQADRHYNVVDLGTLGGIFSAGFGISPTGQVVGASYTSGDTDFHAFIFDGVLHDLGALGKSSGALINVNGKGQAAGRTWSSGSADSHAILYNGTTHDFGTFGGSIASLTELTLAGG
jgi:probable HAF family extracellular repeat protein